MRITLLSKALVNGAYRRKCELMAAHRDVELTVLVPSSWRTDGTTVHLEHQHTESYTLRELPIRFNGNFHLHHYPTLARELKRARPQIFHVDEEPYNLATFLAYRDSRAQQPKTLFFTWQNLRREYPPPFRWMERYVFKASQRAIAGSQEAAQVLRMKGFARQIEVIPQFGVDPDVFTPKPVRHDGFVIGYAGRLVYEKGVDLLLQALRDLPVQACLMIIGSGRELASLRSFAEANKITKRVRFMPTVSTIQMPALYAQLDAFVLSSRTQPNWKEQFGRVLIEAMACGVPVVGSTCGEIPQVIGEAGLLFPEGDMVALRHQLAQLIEQPHLCADLAQLGRSRVLAHYTMQHIAEDTVTVYRKMMEV